MRLERRLYTVEEVAKLTGASESAVYKAHAREELIGLHPGGLRFVRFEPEEVARWIGGNTTVEEPSEERPAMPAEPTWLRRSRKPLVSKKPNPRAKGRSVRAGARSRL